MIWRVIRGTRGEGLLGFYRNEGLEKRREGKVRFCVEWCHERWSNEQVLVFISLLAFWDWWGESRAYQSNVFWCLLVKGFSLLNPIKGSNRVRLTFFDWTRLIATRAPR